MERREIRNKWIRVVSAVMVAILSFFVLGGLATKPETHKAAFEILDREKDDVTRLMAASTAASAAITMIPDDVGTPIADKLAGLSTVFVVLLSVLYMEKYILTIFGFVLFKIIVPACCAAYIFHVFRPERDQLIRILSKWVIFGLVIFHLVPAGTWVSSTIYRNWQDSIEQTLTEAMTVEEEEAILKQAEQDEKEGWLSKLAGILLEDVSVAVDWAKTILNRFVDATAIMLVTSCLIPLFVLFILIGLGKSLCSLDVTRLRNSPRKNKDSEEE